MVVFNGMKCQLSIVEVKVVKCVYQCSGTLVQGFAVGVVVRDSI